MQNLCPNCGKTINNSSKCCYCGEAIKSFPKEFEKYEELYYPVLKSMLSLMGQNEMSPTALFITANGNEPHLFEIYNDGKEESIQNLSKLIQGRKDIVAIIIACEMLIKKNVLDGLSIIMFNKFVVFRDIIPFNRSSTGITFMDNAHIRTDITNHLEMLGVLDKIYKCFMGNEENKDNNRNLLKVRPYVQKIISDTRDFVKTNYHSCPDLEGAIINDIVAHLLLSEAMNMFVAGENNEMKEYAGEIFLYLEKNKLLKDNLGRILSYFIGLMYKNGLLVEKSIPLAMQYFLQCIGKSDSKNGFLMYDIGENFPIELIMGNLDSFIKVAKFELGNLFQS